MVRPFVILLMILGFCPILSGAKVAHGNSAEAVWKSLEQLSAAEREKRLLEGARKEGEMVWYTNSGIENATRYIQAFRKKYPFINANFWRSKTRQVTQRVVSEANAGRHLVDVIKPSFDLLPIFLERNIIGRYDTPLRANFPAHAKSPFYTNMNYAFRVFSYNPRKLSQKDVPKSWEELLNPKWKGEILFDESSVEEVTALLGAWGKEKTLGYFTRLSQQQLLVRVGRDTTAQMMMAGEAPLAVTSYAYNTEGLRAKNAPIDWVPQDLIPALIYPLTMARQAPHPHAGALFYDFMISEEGQRLIAQEGRVVTHPKVEPIYPRMKELQNLLGTPRVQINTLEQNAKLIKDGVQILDEVVLKRKSSGH
jgi:iron(III) transport system substrate-binding protein